MGTRQENLLFDIRGKGLRAKSTKSTQWYTFVDVNFCQENCLVKIASFKSDKT